VTASGDAQRDRRPEASLPVDACYHCGRLPDADGDHSCPCPKRDGECPEHDPITTFAEYQRRYTPEAYQRARIEALTPEQAVRYMLRSTIRQIGDDIFAERMGEQHKAFCGIKSLAFGDGCRHGWANCPKFLASLTPDQRAQIEAMSDPEWTHDPTH